MDDDIGGAPLAGDSIGKNIKAAAFVPSRWETVDPHEAEEQAMTTSKWEMLERENKNYNSESIDQDSPDDDFNETRYFKSISYIDCYNHRFINCTLSYIIWIIYLMVRKHYNLNMNFL